MDNRRIMYGMAVNDLGIRIKRAREARGWSQEDLADALTVQRGGKRVGARSVGRWERGETEPRTALGALEAVLGDLTGDREELDPREQEIMAMQTIEPGLKRQMIELYRLRRRGDEAAVPHERAS